MIFKDEEKTLWRAATTAALIFYSVHSAIGQNVAMVDSLKLVYSSQDLSDSQRFETLRLISLNLPDPNEAMAFAEDLLQQARSKGNKYYETCALLHIGTFYRIKGQYMAAIEYLFKSADLAQSHDFMGQLGLCYSEIALTYANNSNYSNSILYGEKALRIYDLVGDATSKAITLLNIGWHYFQSGNLDSALYYYNMSEPQFADLNLTIGTAYVIGNRALVLAKRGDLPQAEEDVAKAIELLEPLEDHYGITDYLVQLGGIYAEQGQTSEAIEKVKSGLSRAEQMGLKEQIRDASLLLSRIYFQSNDYEPAYSYQSKYYLYRDSIQNAENTQKIADERTAYEVGLKQAELDATNAQKQSQQYFLTGTVAFALLLIALVVLVYRLLRNKQKANLQLARLNSTKDRFFSIISHDIRGPVQAFNGVASMIKFMAENDQVSELKELADQIGETADGLSSLLDNLLNWAVQQQGQINYVPEKIPVKAMINELAKTFTNVARAKKIELTQDVSEGLCLWSDRNTTSTILRNLINNALKFTEENGRVHLEANKEGEMVNIKVSDNGVGIAPDKLEKLFQFEAKKSTWGTDGEKGLGLGLQLVKEFVNMNKGSISVFSEEGKGTTFVIKLPAFKEEKALRLFLFPQPSTG